MKKKSCRGKLAKPDLVAFMRMKVSTDLEWAYQALDLLVREQDEWEISNNSSRGHNQRGINKMDAPQFTRLWKLRHSNQQVFRDEEKLMCKRMQKYARQLVQLWGKEALQSAACKYYGIPIFFQPEFPL